MKSGRCHPNRELVSLKAEYDRQHTMLRMVQEKESVEFNLQCSKPGPSQVEVEGTTAGLAGC